MKSQRIKFFNTNFRSGSKERYIDLLGDGRSISEINQKNERDIWTYGLVGESIYYDTN
jgi:hypothetical protein